MKILSLTALAGLTLSALPALAGGPVPVAPEPAPMPAPAPVMPVSGDWSGLSAGVSLGYGDVSNGGSGQGMIYGLRGGYDVDYGQWVLGGTASYDMANITAGGTDLNQIARVGLRGGYDLGDTLVYATGGAAWAETGAGGGTQDTGWFAGLGAEQKLGGNWSVSGELLSNQFNNFGGGADLKATTLGVGLNYRF